jgi:glycine hydroxymethyltransferase
MTPGGVRIGTCAVTTRGMVEKDMEDIGIFLDRISKICLETQKKAGKNLKQFLSEIEEEPKLKELAKEVEQFATQFYIPGIDITKNKYYI